MSWNYRVVRTEYPNSMMYKSEQVLEIKEVYYDKDGNIKAFGEAPVPYGESIEEVKECLDLMYKALEQPIVDYEQIKD